MALAAAACAETPRNEHPVAASSVRGAADDSDLWNLAGASTDALIDVDLRALRASEWSRALVTGDFGGEREARRQAFGYDVFTEADRMLVVGSDGPSGTRSLTLARGHFDPARVSGAFAAAAPGAVARTWRDSPVWEAAGRAVALVTPRTLAQGDPDTVRGAIDAAWGMTADARTGPLGGLRRAVDADRNPPALFFALTVTSAMRGRAAGTLEIPPELRRLAGRLDLAADLDIDAVGLFDDAAAAGAAASTWAADLHLVARQPMLMLLGLGPVLDGLAFTAEGTRVHGRLHLPAERREVLAEKMDMVLKLLAEARQKPPTP